MFLAGTLATSAFAEPLCELPPDIEEGKRYTVRFVGDSKERRSKILDVENCWVQTFRTIGNHIWYPIKNILYIGTKPIEKK